MPIHATQPLLARKEGTARALYGRSGAYNSAFSRVSKHLWSSRHWVITEWKLNFWEVYSLLLFPLFFIFFFMIYIIFPQTEFPFPLFYFISLQPRHGRSISLQSTFIEPPNFHSSFCSSILIFLKRALYFGCLTFSDIVKGFATFLLFSTRLTSAIC